MPAAPDRPSPASPRPVARERASLLRIHCKQPLSTGCSPHKWVGRASGVPRRGAGRRSGAEYSDRRDIAAPTDTLAVPLCCAPGLVVCACSKPLSGATRRQVQAGTIPPRPPGASGGKRQCGEAGGNRRRSRDFWKTPTACRYTPIACCAAGCFCKRERQRPAIPGARTEMPRYDSFPGSAEPQAGFADQ